MSLTADDSCEVKGSSRGPLVRFRCRLVQQVICTPFPPWSAKLNTCFPTFYPSPPCLTLLIPLLSSTPFFAHPYPSHSHLYHSSNPYAPCNILSLSPPTYLPFSLRCSSCPTTLLFIIAPHYRSCHNDCCPAHLQPNFMVLSSTSSGPCPSPTRQTPGQAQLSCWLTDDLLHCSFSKPCKWKFNDCSHMHAA